MMNQSLIIAALLVPKGTRSLPDQYQLPRQSQAIGQEFAL